MKVLKIQDVHKCGLVVSSLDINMKITSPIVQPIY